jgi:hypothetical protein
MSYPFLFVVFILVVVSAVVLSPYNNSIEEDLILELTRATPIQSIHVLEKSSYRIGAVSYSAGKNVSGHFWGVGDQRHVSLRKQITPLA